MVLFLDFIYGSMIILFLSHYHIVLTTISVESVLIPTNPLLHHAFLFQIVPEYLEIYSSMVIL